MSEARILKASTIKELTSLISGASASTTPGALNQGGRSISVGKLDPTGTKLIYQAAFGGSYVDDLSFMTVDASGDVYLAGRTYSADFPVTANAVVPVFPGKNLPPGSFASYVLKLNPAVTSRAPKVTAAHTSTLHAALRVLISCSS